MRLIAERMDAGPSRMAAIGYIPSYKPKNPKPVAKLLEDDNAWDRLIDEVKTYIDSFASKRGTARQVKPFVISIIDTLELVDPKESKVSTASDSNPGPQLPCNLFRVHPQKRRRKTLKMKLSLPCLRMKVISWTSWGLLRRNITARSAKSLAFYCVMASTMNWLSMTFRNGPFLLYVTTWRLLYFVFLTFSFFLG